MDWVFVFAVLIACGLFWTLDQFDKHYNREAWWDDDFFGESVNDDEDQNKKAK